MYAINALQLRPIESGVESMTIAPATQATIFEVPYMFEATVIPLRLQYTIYTIEGLIAESATGWLYFGSVGYYRCGIEVCAYCFYYQR
jgi:hypothetical protein